MDSLALVIPVLGCAVMMAVMMWFMQRGRGAPSSDTAEAGQREELASLRGELASLQSEAGDNLRSADPAGG